MTDIGHLARWRFFLLRRQRLVLAVAALGLAGILVCWAVATATYLAPAKVFWDFSLGLQFVLLSLLAVLLSANLYADERQRRTLHLLLAAGISRRAWLVGNLLGIVAVLQVLLIFWTTFSWLMALLLPQSPDLGMGIVLQAQLALSLEIFIIVGMCAAFSFFLRPTIALLAALSLIIFLHSQISLLSVLADAQTGAFNQPLLQPLLQWLVPWLPPLEWYDLRTLVGYSPPLPALRMATLALMALGWSTFWVEVGHWKFRRIDL